MYQRSLLVLAVTLLSLIGSNSYALVIEDASCKAVDAKGNTVTEVTIMDNQGIGFPRVSRPFATVLNPAGQVVFSASVTTTGARGTTEPKGFSAANPKEFSLVEGSGGVAQPRIRNQERFTLTLNGRQESVTCSVFNEL
jgi:hypothetical protein